jgi:hypothetical protein
MTTRVVSPGRVTAGPNNLLLIRRLHEPSECGSMFPALDGRVSPMLDVDERVIWHGPLRTGVLRQKADGGRLILRWEFAAAADVWLTDRRVVYTCRKFTAGDWKTAWTGVEDALASSVNSITAQAHRLGRIAVGHVRHEWPIDVVLARQVPRVAKPKAVVGITCVDPWDDALVRLRFHDPDHAKMAGVARILIRTIAERRLAADGALAPDAAATLGRQRHSPVTVDGQHPFGSGPTVADPFGGLAAGKMLAFSLPGAVKIG